ncbi:MAG: hypothetical protein HS113_06960 [Verrucomicrobiales bacterium]|nr:hypothetical protein [Verrucomicrobiales bacterium]
MKPDGWLRPTTLSVWLLLAAAGTRADGTNALEVLDRGPHHRVVAYEYWSKDDAGNLVPARSTYTELASGLHYSEDGEWKESVARIELSKEGAVARRGGFRVTLSPDVQAASVVDVRTPDAKRFTSRIAGLAYYDSLSGQSVLLAEPKSSVGLLLPPNQVVYVEPVPEVPVSGWETIGEEGE